MGLPGYCDECYANCVCAIGVFVGAAAKPFPLIREWGFLPESCSAIGPKYGDHQATPGSASLPNRSTASRVSRTSSQVVVWLRMHRRRAKVP